MARDGRRSVVPVESDQPNASFSVSHAAGDRQLAVHPGVREDPAVGLDTHQAVAGAAQVMVGAHLEGGGVGVGAEADQTRIGQWLLSHPEGDEAASVADDEVAGAWFE